MANNSSGSPFRNRLIKKSKNGSFKNPKKKSSIEFINARNIKQSISKTSIISAIILIIFISSLGVGLAQPLKSARAVLISPRLGTPIQGPATNFTYFQNKSLILENQFTLSNINSSGNSENSKNMTYLDGTITIWVGTQPSNVPIPMAWKKIENWNVALLPAAMPTANCTLLKVVKIIDGSNKDPLFGMGLGINPLTTSAVGIVCQIPSNILPLLYHIAVGFQTEISTTLQQESKIDLIPKPGSWQGPEGSGNGWLPAAGKTNPFLLTEACAVTIPWIYDAKPSNSRYYISAIGKNVNPFNILHVTDTHYNPKRSDILLQNYLWQNDSQIINPDVIILTGDVLDDPNVSPEEFDIAYRELTKLNIPIVILGGNHDQYLSGPWRFYFGEAYGITRFDDLTIIKFDSSLPLSSGVLNQILQQSHEAIKQGPVFLACHYPLIGSYFSSGWPAVVDEMVKDNITAILHGHTHSDFITDVKNIQDYYLQLAEGGEKAIGELYPKLMVDPNVPSTTPKMVITRSAGKPSDISFPDYYPGELPEEYSGYRQIVLTNNGIVNYTYDYNNDGKRDLMLGIPNGRFNYSIIYDNGIGINLNAGAWWYLTNHFNEDLVLGRAQLILPLPPSGTRWALNSLNITNGAYIKSVLYNSTSTWLDIRVPIPKNTNISLRIEPVSITN